MENSSPCVNSDLQFLTGRDGLPGDDVRRRLDRRAGEPPVGVLRQELRRRAPLPDADADADGAEAQGEEWGGPGPPHGDGRGGDGVGGGPHSLVDVASTTIKNLKKVFVAFVNV